MEIILLERVEKLGQMGDVVKVKDGFARNYLLPTKKAIRSTKANLAFFEAQKVQLEAKNIKIKSEADKLAEKMKGLSIDMIRQAAETGQLYGSVTIRDLQKEIATAGFEVERKQIVLDTSIKTLGSYDVKISLHPDVAQNVKINIARSDDDFKDLVEKETKAEAPVEAEVKEEATAE